MTLPDREDDPRWWRIAVVCVGAVALVTGIAIIDALPVGVFHDDAMYVILARSLASGHGYRYLNLPGAPVATQHPPGYPALLALVSMFVPAFPANIVAFKTLNALLAAASTVLVVLFARARALDPVPAIALGVASAVSIPLLLLSSMVLSEPLFFLLVVALLFAIERFVERQNGSWRPMAIGIGIAACALVRLNGIALLPATLVILAFKRRWRDAGIVTLATVVALLPWQVMVATHTGVLPAPLRGDYESASSWWLRGLHAHGPHVVIETIRKVVAEGAGMFGVLFSAMRGDLAHSITLVALATLSIAAVAAIRSRLPVTLLFLCGYLGIVVVWPYAPSRFLWAIWPLFLLLFTAGANWAWRGIAARRIRASDTRGTVARYAVLVAFAWVVVGYAEYEQRGLRDRWWSSASRSNAGRVAAAVAWVHDNTSLNDLVASEDEGAVYLYTGRHAVPIRSLAPDAYLRDIPASEAARDGLQPILAAYPVRVVVAGSRQTAETADVLIVSTPALLGSAIDFPGGVAYRVIARAGIAR